MREEKMAMLSTGQSLVLERNRGECGCDDEQEKKRGQEKPGMEQVSVLFWQFDSTESCYIGRELSFRLLTSVISPPRLNGSKVSWILPLDAPLVTTLH